MMVEIISSEDTEGSAIDGEFSNATFKVLEGSQDTVLNREKVCDLFLKWNNDCHVQRYGFIRGTNKLAGVLVFIDCKPPCKGAIILLE